MFNKDKDGNVIRDEIDKAVKGFPKVFGILDEAVKSGFYGSDSFSMADCFLLPILNSVQRYPEGKDAVESAANVSAYFNAHSERSSFVETTP
jgi:glutathione S-transferase